MNALVSAAVRRPVSTIMVVLAVVVVGVLAALSLGLFELPDVRLPKLVVSTSYPGLPGPGGEDTAHCSARGLLGVGTRSPASGVHLREGDLDHHR